MPRLHGLDTVDRFRAEDPGPLGDAPAQLAFEAMADAFADGSVANIELAVYRLEPVGNADQTLHQRTDELSDLLDRAATRPGHDQESTWTMLGASELRIDRNSGTERFLDWDRFHHGDPIAGPLADAHYWSVAGDYLEDALLTPTEGIDLYPYKIRHYWNAVAEQGRTATEEMYQVAVAFNATIDGMPVIGSGSKVSIHLALDGTIIGHELSTRRVGDAITTIGGDDLLHPEAAHEAIARRLTERGVDMAQYRWTRAELGYLRLGRSSVQDIVAPHYAFVAEPLEGVVGKKLLEVIPATTRPDVLALLERDFTEEGARKQALMANAAAPDSRPSP
ncbi:hypothetical protein [Paraliomyxa miuraensis]|uniref:hypothetical protein n=1 Tax=Paraliomyxa miuraensis TaxID=376150 RepID=UPI00225554F6|nr:hypothetical protein [Paraliomyxa miuraensis]MCX4247792.1 hypothetical protein [Paraliomyxa miuraensis]